MKGQRILVSMLALGLMLALTVGLSQAGGLAAPSNVPAQDLAPLGTAASAPLSTSFTYQGQLKLSGVPVNGLCDFQFGLWDSASGGTQIGTITQPNVQVTNGLFTVQLDFGSGAFTGEARWLEIAVRYPAGSGSYTPLSQRQQLTAAPYALSLRPGTIISGTAYQNLKVMSNAPTGGIPAALTGEMLTAKDGVGVYGSHNNTAADAGGAGVWGRTWSPLGSGVEGTGINGATGVKGTSDTGYGVYGSTAGGSSTPAGVYGTGRTGVKGESTVTNGTGVQGTANNGTAAWGVFGTSTAGIGVRGASSSGVGVWALGAGAGMGAPALYANSSNASGIAVLGQSNSSDTTIVAWNQGTGDAFRSLNQAGYVAFRVLNTGQVVAPVVQITGGADLAEKFAVHSEDVIEPGTLMVIDEDNPGQLKVSTTAYDTKVAGVVSGAGGVNPGLTLHQQGVMQGDTLVAIAGRVYVRAEAFSGPIKPGDLLTSSSIPGHAMKATERERALGALIGKAMSSLDKGQGLVLVLVSLQ